MSFLLSLITRHITIKVSEYLIMESIKAFIKTKKGKAIIIAAVLGITGVSLPPEAVEAIIVLLGVAGI